MQVIHDTTASTIYRLVDGAVRDSLYGAGALAAETWSNDDDETVEAHPRVAGAHRGDQRNLRRSSWPIGKMASR